MREEARENLDWANEEFGHAEPGDARRTARIVRMVAALAERPGGKVLEVFRSGAEQQAAYDLLGNPHVGRETVLAGGQIAGAPAAAEVAVARHKVAGATP